MALASPMRSAASLSSPKQSSSHAPRLLPEVSAEALTREGRRVVQVDRVRRGVPLALSMGSTPLGRGGGLLTQPPRRFNCQRPNSRTNPRSQVNTVSVVSVSSQVSEPERACCARHGVRVRSVPGSFLRFNMPL